MREIILEKNKLTRVNPSHDHSMFFSIYLSMPPIDKLIMIVS